MFVGLTQRLLHFHTLKQHNNSDMMIGSRFEVETQDDGDVIHSDEISFLIKMENEILGDKHL